MTRLASISLTTGLLVHEILERIEQVRTVVRTCGRFRMVLDAKGGVELVANPGDGVVV